MLRNGLSNLSVEAADLEAGISSLSLTEICRNESRIKN